MILLLLPNLILFIFLIILSCGVCKSIPGTPAIVAYHTKVLLVSLIIQYKDLENVYIIVARCRISGIYTAWHVL